MKWKDEELPALQLMEKCILDVWRQHPEMSDYVAGRAYEAAHKFYRAESQGSECEPPDFKGLDAKAFNALNDVCTRLLSVGTKGSEEVPEIPPVTLEFLTRSLRELSRSVERHTKRGGRQGYLEFLAQYMP